MREQIAEIVAANHASGFPSQKAALFEKERLEILEPERAAEERVVAELRMSIERQMRTVNGEVAFHERANQCHFLARPGNRRAPKQSVMREQQIRLLAGREEGRRQRSVHGRGDF